MAEKSTPRNEPGPVSSDDRVPSPSVGEMWVALASLETAKKKKTARLVRIQKVSAEIQAQVNNRSTHISAKIQDQKDLTRVEEEKSLESKKIHEKVDQAIQDNSDLLEKLDNQAKTLNSDCAEHEFLGYHDIVRGLLEWQGADTSKAEVSVQQTSEPQEKPFCVVTSFESAPAEALPVTTEPTVSSAHSSTLDSHSDLGRDCAGFQLVLSDPQRFMEAWSLLKHHNFSLINIAASDDAAAKAVRLSNNVRIRQTQETEKSLSLLRSDMENIISLRKNREMSFKEKTEKSSEMQDQDVLEKAVEKKVTELYSVCREDSQLPPVSTYDEVCVIESQMFLLLRRLGDIPSRALRDLTTAMDRTNAERLHEAKLRADLEKKEKMRQRNLERSLSEAKKTVGRRPMPRSFPIKKTKAVTEEASVTPNDNPNNFLFFEYFE